MSGNHSKLRTPNWWRNKLQDECFKSNGDAGRFKKSFSRIECDRWDDNMTHSELLDIYEEHWNEYLCSSDGDEQTKLEMTELLGEEANKDRLMSIMDREPWISIDQIYRENLPPIDELQQYLKLKRGEHQMADEEASKQEQEKLDKFKKLKKRKFF